jgi:hypothetical protein
MPAAVALAIEAIGFAEMVAFSIKTIVAVTLTRTGTKNPVSR